MRRLVVALVGLLLVAAPTAAASTVAQVGTRAITTEEVRAAFGRVDRFAVSALIERRWVEGGARARGIAVDPAAVDQLVAAQQQAFGGEARWREALAAEGVTEEQVRAGLEAGLRREALGKALAAKAMSGRAYAQAFDRFYERQRARTTCTAAGDDAVFARCRNRRPARGGTCRWFGGVDLCRFRTRGTPDLHLLRADLIGRLVESPAAEDADTGDGEELAASLRRTLRRIAPGVERRVEFEYPDDFEARAARRSDLATVAFAIARAHERAVRSWRLPAVDPSGGSR